MRSLIVRLSSAGPATLGLGHPTLRLSSVYPRSTQTWAAAPTWAGSQPPDGIVPVISLIASAYWFAYFLVILPLLGVIEKPLPQPETIEEDFEAHYGKAANAAGAADATPAE